MKKFLTLALVSFLSATSFADLGRKQRVALFVGVDVSGSFKGYQQDAIAFVAHYIHGHLTGIGGLEPVRALFVGAVGGNNADENKSFHPIEDFQGKSVAQIEADIKAWFPKSDSNTDFNVFFNSVARIATKRNLALTPIEVVLVTDGVPDTPGEKEARISAIDVSALEFLSRRVTLRLLYPDPTICSHWETLVPRNRMRMWTVDHQVMTGWRHQFHPGTPEAQQTDLWKWVLNNVDYRVGPGKFKVAARKK
jgi:hypothetical protein